MSGYVQKARASDILFIAGSIRSDDRREIEAMSTLSPTQALWRSYRMSTSCWTGFVDNDPILMFGVAPLTVLGGVGSPWLIGTDAILKVKHQFLRMNAQFVEKMNETYPVLHNYVDVRNTHSVRWLKWLGFKFDDPVEYGLNGEKFYPFMRERGQHNVHIRTEVRF